MLLYYWNSRYRGDKVTFKKLIIILMITVSLLITMLLGTSYAWYEVRDAYTTFSNVSTYNEDVGLAVVFANTDNISSTVGAPIFESEIDNYSNKTIFSMTPNSELINGRQIAYQISLVNVEIDEELTTTEDLKYSLMENGVQIKTGSFKNFVGDTLVLKDMTVLETLDITYNYEFRLWLQDNGCTIDQINDPTNECESQNDLMGKKISGKIKVSTALK